MPRSRLTFEERFWSYVDKNGPIPEHCPELGPCWLWIGHDIKGGYGRIYRAGKLEMAHRIGYELGEGEPPPSGLCVLHRCDNPPCVRRTHHFLGTRLDNNRDRHAKGRSSGGRVLESERRARGERQGSAKLTPDDVIEIRRRAADNETQRSLARRFAIGKTAIREVIRRETWRHVE